MSSIKLSPNASGTGEFTIAAPNSNTNRTLTLPDASGTFLTNSGTEAGAFSTLSVNSNNISAVNSLGFRNRILNGDCRIDQRNAGASVTPATETYTLDRWLLRQPTGIYSIQQQSSTVPSNFSSAIRLAVASVQGSIAAGTVNNLTQYIEGLNISDLGWGTASASAVTLSFWVRSSVTGTYSACLYNGGFTRAYVATYQVNSANTWEFKTITITGDTAGTWQTTNQVGIALAFDLGSGSNYNGTAGAWGAGALKTAGSVNLSTSSGATFFITGVQLEAGSVATPFERRDYGRELIMCQRYFSKSYLLSVAPGSVSQPGAHMCPFLPSGNTLRHTVPFKVSMRAAPTVTIFNPETGTAGFWCSEGGGATNQAAGGITFISESSALVFSTSSPINGIYYFQWRAESEL